MIKINLIGEGRRPAAVRKRRDLSASFKKENLVNYMLVVGLVLGLLPLGIEWWWLKSTEERLQEQVAELKDEYDVLKPIIDEVNAYKKQQSELERKIEVINDLKVNQKGPVKVMDYVSRSVPELVWLRRMEVKTKTLRLSGNARNENAVATLIDNLDQYDEFQEPVLRHMRETRGGLYSFEITLNYSLKRSTPADGSQAAGG